MLTNRRQPVEMLNWSQYYEMLQVRRNSAHSFKLRGQTLEALANISDDGRGNDQSMVKKVVSSFGYMLYILTDI